MYRKLASDDQDSVRLLTIQDLIAIAQQLTPAEVKEHLIVQIRNAVGDKSWRVRYMVSNHFTEVWRVCMHDGDTDKVLIMDSVLSRSWQKPLGLSLYGLSWSMPTLPC